jgi:hypothetical protein
MAKGTYPNMYRHAYGTLIASCQIVADPGNVPRKSWIYAHDGNEDSGVNDARHPSANGSEHDNEADGNHSHEEEDERRPLAMAVRVISTDDGDASGGDVDGNRQQLRSGCRVAKIPDNGW